MQPRDYFPFYDKLEPEHQELLTRYAVRRSVPEGALLHNGEDDCMGLILIVSGQLRAFISSDEGKEITVYRLFSRDICLFSASCIMRGVQFNITITAEKPTEFWLLPPHIYKRLMEQSALIANYTNEIIASHFSEVIWLVEQIMWRRFDQRLAAFLLEESALDGSSELFITHERIASHMGTAREVVTRMLRYFQSDGIVALSRGSIRLLDEKRLNALAR